MLIYSDGLTDAFPINGDAHQAFGVQSVKEALRASAREELDELSVLLVEHMALGAKGEGHVRLPHGLGERLESLLDPDAGWADEKK